MSYPSQKRKPNKKQVTKAMGLHTMNIAERYVFNTAPFTRNGLNARVQLV